jgi:isopentenyl diphosphate isomerase/L-lactate dehydrogenase-like FMN-dependent dehydrogenase
MTTPFADFQNEVYLNGLFGEQPTLPFGWRETEAAAYAAMTPGAVGYVAGGAGGEDTMRANRRPSTAGGWCPRMLRGIPAQRVRTRRPCSGTTMPAPGACSPRRRAVDRAPGGRARRRPRRRRGSASDVVSTASSNTMEDVAAAGAGRLPLVPALLAADRDLAASFVRRAEARGYEAVVVTLDTWQLGWRPRDLSQAYLPFLQGAGRRQLLRRPGVPQGLEKTPEEDQGRRC